MKRRQLGLAGLILLASMTFAVVGGIAVLQAVAGADPGDTGSVRGRLLVTVTMLAAFGIGLAYVAGSALANALKSLRAGVLARARGDSSAPLPPLMITELAGIASAVERLSARDAAREAELKRESAEVQVLLDATSESILRLDRAGRMLRANPAARRLFGLDETALGQPIATYVRPVDLRRLIMSAAAGEPLAPTETIMDDRRLIVSGRPVESITDERGGAVVAFMDLTEVRRLESVRRDFVANVSHELKTPLTSIRGYVETLLSDELPVEVQRQFLEVIRKNAARLHHIVDDLLDLSRLESGGWRPEPQTIDAAPLIREVWSGCSTQAADRRIRFSQPAGPVRVVADPAGLRQVLANLLDNALRYTPEGGSIHVCAGGEEQVRNEDAGVAREPFVAFQIRDTGAGIPSDALPRIFERFYRADPARSRAEGGTGLGLSIVKHLVERMGGDVSAESELGKGTTVTFRIPAAPEQA